MIRNKEEGIKYIYTASGLVSEVSKNNVSLVKFFYNDKGFRVRKQRYNEPTETTQTTYYVRDVAGPVMTIIKYQEKVAVKLPFFMLFNKIIGFLTSLESLVLLFF